MNKALDTMIESPESAPGSSVVERTVAPSYVPPQLTRLGNLSELLAKTFVAADQAGLMPSSKRN